MKKIFLALAALVGTMSMNAQIVKIMKGGDVVASYTAEQVDSVLFEEEQGPTTAGTAMRTGNIAVKWIQLWENGPKFAEYNVGAENNKPEDYGGYYCWGETTDKDPTGNGVSGSESLTGNDDTATNLWGSNWRMPTRAELDSLIAKCDVEWVTINNVKGRKFTGKGDYATNSIFLPAAGNFGLGNVNMRNVYGYYWSSTYRKTDTAYYLYITSSNQTVNMEYRYKSFSVRAVLKEN